MILFFSLIGSSSPGFALENNTRSDPRGAITGGGAGVPGPLADAVAAVLPDEAELPELDAGAVAQALLLLRVRPAITHGVVSDRTSTMLPGGWLMAMVAVEDDAEPPEPDVDAPVLPEAADVPEAEGLVEPAVPVPDVPLDAEEPVPLVAVEAELPDAGGAVPPNAAVTAPAPICAV